MEALNRIIGAKALRYGRLRHALQHALRERIDTRAIRLNAGLFAGKGEHKAIEIADEVGKLLSMAFLSGSNIAVERVAGVEQLPVIWGVAEYAPRFSKIAIVCKEIGRHDVDLFIRKRMKVKHDIAIVAESIAKEYEADLLVCPFPNVNYRRIMNFCRTRSNYLTALDRRFDRLIGRGSIEGINSIDLLLTPTGSGFIMHELRWLSRNETEHGTDIHGEDLLEMNRIGTNGGLERRPEDTKYAYRYSKSVGERIDTAWRMVIQSKVL